MKMYIVVEKEYPEVKYATSSFDEAVTIAREQASWLYVADASFENIMEVEL